MRIFSILINLSITMLKQQSQKLKFTVYTTPFILKNRLSRQTSPNKQGRQENHHKRSRSPYTIKNYISKKDRKETRIFDAPIQKEEDSQTIFVRSGKNRVMSAPHKPSKDFIFSARDYDKQRSNEAQFEKKSRNITNYFSLKVLKTNISSSSPFAVKSTRKFNFEIVKTDKQKLKGQLLADKKIQKYNYKTVIGQPLPFRTKKVRQILIGQDGKVTYQKN